MYYGNATLYHSPRSCTVESSTQPDLLPWLLSLSEGCGPSHWLCGAVISASISRICSTNLAFVTAFPSGFWKRGGPCWLPRLAGYPLPSVTSILYISCPQWLPPLHLPLPPLHLPLSELVAFGLLEVNCDHGRSSLTVDCCVSPG